MPPTPNRTPKHQFLRQHGTLHPRPQDVTHELFQDRDFFDPQDLVQVKYEMLREVRVEQKPIQQAAKNFGLSRPSFYQAQMAFQEFGLAGLLPRQRGPRGGHKLTDEVMKFVMQTRAADPSLSLQQLARAVQQKFDLTVHPRSIERQLRRQKKLQ
jgi:transposase